MSLTDNMEHNGQGGSSYINPAGSSPKYEPGQLRHAVKQTMLGGGGIIGVPGGGRVTKSLTQTIDSTDNVQRLNCRDAANTAVSYGTHYYLIDING